MGCGMVDVGFNLMLRAMLRRKSIARLDARICDLVGGDDPYNALRFYEGGTCIHKDAVIRLSAVVGIPVEKAFCPESKSVDLLYQLISTASNENVLIDGVVFIGGEENPCSVDLAVCLWTSDSSRMTVVCRLSNPLHSPIDVSEVTVCFWAGGKTVDYEIESQYVNPSRFVKALKNKADFFELVEGCSVFDGGSNALVEHLYDIWVPRTRPWAAEFDDELDRKRQCENEYVLSPASARYTASFGSETYSIVYSSDNGGTWKIESIQSNKFKYVVDWREENNPCLHLFLQNGYELYASVKESVKESVARVLSGMLSGGQMLANASRDSSNLNDGASQGGGVLEKAEKDIARQESLFPVEKVRFNDLLVRSAIRTCGHSEHDIRSVTAVVCVFAPERGVVEESVSAFCCPQCKRYYVLEDEFDKLVQKGKLCCRVITHTGRLSALLPRTDGDSALSDESLYYSLGYNVSQESHLSAAERRAVLDFIVVNGFRSRKQTISFLEWLIARNSGKANMRNAVLKWQSDVDYLMRNSCKDVERVKIDRVFLTKRKWR